MEEIEKGDIVTLKSGGPDMTVESIVKNRRGTYANVFYFYEGKMEHKGFDVAILKKVKKEDS